MLKRLADAIRAGDLPLKVTEAWGDDEAPLSTQDLTNLIRQCREIELQTVRDKRLELGEITDPSQFVPDEDDDWTR